MQQHNSIDYDRAVVTVGGKTGIFINGGKKEVAFIFRLKLSLEKGRKDGVQQVALVSISSSIHLLIAPRSIFCGVQF